MSRTLTACESRYPIIEKEAASIIEAVRKWSHYLYGRPFTLITDQRSLAFMFDQANRGKIKNAKIQAWRTELGMFSYKVIHRPGSENVAPDALSRVCSVIGQPGNLRGLHESLGHPGVSRSSSSRYCSALTALKVQSFERILSTAINNLDISPNDSEAPATFKYWLATFEKFLEEVEKKVEEVDKQALLINFLSPTVYPYVEDHNTYDSALGALKAAYIKRKNDIFARHILATRKQQNGENLEQFLQALKIHKEIMDKLLKPNNHWRSGPRCS